MAARPPRILMLCGFSQNGSIFSGKLGAVRKAIKDSAELVFVDPPHIVEMPHEAYINNSKYDAGPSGGSDDTPRTWWFNEPKNHGRVFEKMDETLIYLRKVLDEQGPFDGVWGFSQGASCAVILTTLLATERRRVSTSPTEFLHPAFEGCSHPPFKFCIAVSGFLPGDLRIQEWMIGSTPVEDILEKDSDQEAHRKMQKLTPKRAKLSTFSLHVLGRGDTIIETERSTPLATEVFMHPRIEYHDGGHHVPSKASWRSFWADYLKCHAIEPKDAELSAEERLREVGMKIKNVESPVGSHKSGEGEVYGKL